MPHLSVLHSVPAEGRAVGFMCTFLTFGLSLRRVNFQGCFPACSWTLLCALLCVPLSVFSCMSVNGVLCRTHWVDS